MKKEVDKVGLSPKSPTCAGRQRGSGEVPLGPCRRWLTSSRKAYLQAVLRHRACGDDAVVTQEVTAGKAEPPPTAYSSPSLLGCGT